MGIVNVTPDSFSDGGKYLKPDAAVAHALALAAQGAEILGVGGQSTRPGAKPVDEKEEIRRVVPVVTTLAAIFKTQKVRPPAIAVDTMKPAVARAVLDAGASIINDVAANRGDSEMWKIVSEYGAGYIAMHAPPGLHKKNAAKDILRDVAAFFSDRFKKLKAAGIAPEQIVFDPGIGFGKDLEQNLRLIACLRGFTQLRRPLLLGVSRKSFIGKLLGAGANERLPASLACAILGVEAGAHIIRAHDVAETVQAIRMAESLLAKRRCRG